MTLGFARSPQLLMFLGVLAFLAQAQIASAQLRVLSTGDVAQQWKRTQLEQLQRQLGNLAIRDGLRDELESQKLWLEAWNPGKLDSTPLLKPSKTLARLVEPVIDPDKAAQELRSRLFGPDAKPSVKDTRALQQLLGEQSGDVGVHQLHLHWLDQRQYRKIYPDEIADAASNLFGLLERIKPQNDAVRRAKLFCLYRRGRALAYRELPEVVAQKPIQDPKQHESALLGAYAQLVELAGKGRPEFILLEIRMLRRDHWNGRALALLESHAGVIEKRWFLKKRRDLLRDLNWEKPSQEAAAIYANAFPDAIAEENKEG